MATVPIEIVLQDAEVPVDPTPTPTPESGEETNIVVPNTGTISNDGSNNGGIGSTISIILPIVIAVSALGAMVALLVRRQEKRKSNINASISKKEKLATAISGTIAILAATVLVGNLVIPATNAATSVAPGTAELETEDKITIIATREQDSDTITATVKDTSYATANLDFGYKVTASMAEGLTTANLYLDGDETSEYYIAPVEDGTLADNTWGYTLEEPSEDIAYLSIPLEDTPTTIVKGSGEIEDEAVDIYYTIKVDESLPAGTYTGELEYTIAPVVEYMQDFAKMTEAEKTATLANMPEGEQYILKDIRDEKPYYISKLADGNVWMTQNLDLDIDEDTTYTHADTDLGWSDSEHPDPTAKWKPENSTITKGNLSPTTWPSDEQASYNPYSYDPDELYVYSSGTDADDDVYASLAVCKGDHSDCDLHSHAGNYYNWSAAVAMNDTSEYGDDDQFVNVETSICPAGWRLPKNANVESYTVGNEQITMIASYNGILGDYSQWGVPGGSYSYQEDGFNDIRSNPLCLVRAGAIYNGSLDNVGYSGSYLSSTNKGVSVAYLLYLYPSYVAQANGTFKRNGDSVRCIAR